MTWNIHGGVGPDRQYQLERIVELVRRHDPDVVALQEVETRGGHTDDLAFEVLTEALGSHSAEARTIEAPDGAYGHMLISRWPMSPPILHDLTVSRREARMAIETLIDTPCGPLHIAAVHLGLKLNERRKQAAILASIARTSEHTTTAMLGDFNDWSWHAVVRRTLAELLPSRTMLKTFPSFWPLFMLDRIYCRPEGALVRSWTDPEGRKISDHLPVIADIAMPSMIRHGE